MGQVRVPTSFGERKQKFHVTRLHSSRMRTAHLLTVSQHALGRGVSAQGGVCLRGCLPEGVSARGGVCRGDVSQHAMGQSPHLWTDRHL